MAEPELKHNLIKIRYGDNHRLIKDVSNALKHYAVKTRREEAFDLSGPMTPAYDLNQYKFNKLFGYSNAYDKVLKRVINPDITSRLKLCTEESDDLYMREKFYKEELTHHCGPKWHQSRRSLSTSGNKKSKNNASTSKSKSPQRRSTTAKQQQQQRFNKSGHSSSNYSSSFLQQNSPRTATTGLTKRSKSSTQSIVPAGMLALRNTPTANLSKREKIQILDITSKIMSANNDILLMQNMANTSGNVCYTKLAAARSRRPFNMQQQHERQREKLEREYEEHQSREERERALKLAALDAERERLRQRNLEEKQRRDEQEAARRQADAKRQLELEREAERRRALRTSDKEHERLHALPEVDFGDKVRMRVTVKTGDRQGSQFWSSFGTLNEEKMHIQLFGQNKGKSPLFTLNKSLTHRIPFCKGHKDVFELDVPKQIGKVYAISIGHMENDIQFNWFLDYVRIEDPETNKCYYFYSDEWFGNKSKDGKTHRMLFKDKETNLASDSESEDGDTGSLFQEEQRQQKEKKQARKKATGRSSSSSSSSSSAASVNRRDVKSKELFGKTDNASKQKVKNALLGEFFDDDKKGKKKTAGSRSSSSASNLSIDEKNKKSIRQVVSEINKHATITKAKQQRTPSVSSEDGDWQKSKGGPKEKWTLSSPSAHNSRATSPSTAKTKQSSSTSTSATTTNGEHRVITKSLTPKNITKLTALEAVEEDNLDALKDIAQRTPQELEKTDARGRTLLLVACEKGHDRLVKFLVETKDSLMQVDTPQEGLYPVHVCAKHNHLKCLFILYDMGASLAAKTSAGLTPLHLAAQQGHYDVVKWLVDHNARGIQIMDNSRQTPYDLALKNKHVQVANFLAPFCGKDIIDPTETDKKRNKVKIVLVGDQRSGKTSLLNRYLYNKFAKSESKKTIGIDCVYKSSVEFETRVQLCDTAGHERYRSLITSFLRESHAIVIVYDASKHKPMHVDVAIQKWLAKAQVTTTKKENSPLIVIVGNKADLLEKHQDVKAKTTSIRHVLKELLRRRPKNPLSTTSGRGVKYFETSAKTGRNVRAVFDYILKELDVK